MSITIYRRHKPKCKYENDRSSKKCRCALWLTGTLFGEPYRKAAKTRSWEAAEKIKRNLEDGSIHQQPERTVQDALQAFIRDCESRNLNASTLRKYRLLQKRFEEFVAEGRLPGLERLAGFTAEVVRDFRGTWKLSPRTASKQLERLRAFFRFCCENEWLTKNPAKSIKAPQVKLLPRLPFNETEVQNIIAQAKDDRDLAFVLVLRHTGLRIGDASLLKVSQVSEGRVYLYTTKAGTPVSIKIPDTLSSLLKKITPVGGYFFLRGESTSMHTVADLWRRSFKRWCKAAGVSPDHPHRMRTTLACDLLGKGATVEDVANILGNSPAVVIKHYRQFVKANQDHLDELLEKTWEKPKLKLVK